MQRPKATVVNPTLEQVARLAGVTATGLVVTGAVPVPRTGVERAIAEPPTCRTSGARDLRRATTTSASSCRRSRAPARVFRLAHRAPQRGGSTVLVRSTTAPPSGPRSRSVRLAHARRWSRRPPGSPRRCSCSGAATSAWCSSAPAARPGRPASASTTTAGSRLPTEHLIALGHRRIALGGALDGSTLIAARPPRGARRRGHRHGPRPARRRRLDAVQRPGGGRPAAGSPGPADRDPGRAPDAGGGRAARRSRPRPADSRGPVAGVVLRVGSHPLRDARDHVPDGHRRGDGRRDRRRPRPPRRGAHRRAAGRPLRPS